MGRKREEGRTGGRGQQRVLPFLEAEQEQRVDRRRRLWWWRWLVLVALLGLCVAVVVSALGGTELLVIGFGAAAVLLCAVLIVFG